MSSMDSMTAVRPFTSRDPGIEAECGVSMAMSGETEAIADARKEAASRRVDVCEVGREKKERRG